MTLGGVSNIFLEKLFCSNTVYKTQTLQSSFFYEPRAGTIM